MVDQNKTSPIYLMFL